MLRSYNHRKELMNVDMVGEAGKLGMGMIQVEQNRTREGVF